jgi:hypothetical protein
MILFWVGPVRVTALWRIGRRRRYATAWEIVARFTRPYPDLHTALNSTLNVNLGTRSHRASLFRR